MSYSEESFLGINLSEYAYSVEELISGDTVEMEADTTTFRFIPVKGGKYIKITKNIQIVESNSDGISSFEVGAEVFYNDILRVVSYWVDEALEINPGLRDKDWFQNISEGLESSKEAIEQTEFEYKY